MSIICYCMHIKCSKTVLRLGGGARLKNPTLSNSNSTWNARTRFNEFL